MKRTLTTPQYPEIVMASIQAAKLNPPQNHLVVADQLLRFAKSDVTRAARTGYHMVTGTKHGNLNVTRTGKGTFRVNNFNTGAQLHAGTTAETIAFVAASYKLVEG